MDNRRALSLIRKNRPSSLTHFKELGLLGRFINAGVFRETYRVKNTDYVVKFPLGEGRAKHLDYHEGINHSRQEMKRLNALAAFKEFRPHLPKVFYYDPASGIIVMRRYSWIPTVSGWKLAELMGAILQKVIKKAYGIRMRDIHGDNVGVAGMGEFTRIVFMDLGY